MPQEIDGTLVTIQISADNGVTRKTIVCEDSSQYNATSSTNETKTKCGTFSANEVNSPTISGSGVAGGNLLSSQVSFNDLATYQKNQTTLWVLRQNAPNTAAGITAGEITYQNGYAKVSEVTETSAVGDITKFTFTLTFSGEVDVNAASS